MWNECDMNSQQVPKNWIERDTKFLGRSTPTKQGWSGRVSPPLRRVKTVSRPVLGLFYNVGGNFYTSEKTEHQLPNSPNWSAILCVVFNIIVFRIAMPLSNHSCCREARMASSSASVADVGDVIYNHQEWLMCLFAVWKLKKNDLNLKSITFSQPDILRENSQ